MRTLVLNAGYEPLAVVSFKRALVLVMNDKATRRRRATRASGLGDVRGVGAARRDPAHALRAHPARPRTSPVSRRGVLRRDDHRCGYCGKSATTIDHVLPRSRGGRDTWENLVACCLRCNNVKSDRTPAEMGWELRFTPYVPREGGWRVRGMERTLPEWDAFLEPAA